MRIILTGPPILARRSLEIALHNLDSSERMICFGGSNSDADFRMVRTQTGWTVTAQRRVP